MEDPSPEQGEPLLGRLRESTEACRCSYLARPLRSVATEQDREVAELLDEWLKVFLHGLRAPPFRSVVVALLPAVRANALHSCLWNYARLHLTRHEEERFLALKHVNTPLGYFRAFLRSALNERSLERYLQSWIGHPLRTRHYEDWALMRDPVNAKHLPEVAAASASVLFALSLDRSRLNDGRSESEPLAFPEPVISQDAPVPNSNTDRTVRRRIVLFHDETVPRRSPDPETALPRPVSRGDDDDHDDHDDQETPDGSDLLMRQYEKNAILELKISQMEEEFDQRAHRMEQVIFDLTKDNDRLKEQLRNYVSAVEVLKVDPAHNREIRHYEEKLVQVAQMHAELMEFNETLQKRLRSPIEPFGAHYPLSSLTGISDGRVSVWIPSTYLISEASRSFHVYQIFLKIAAEEWNVYRRYSEFRRLYDDLRNAHPDVSSCKFPPKKTLGKKEAWLVEQRRTQLQSWLRHIVQVLPQLRQSRSRRDLSSLLPFFDDSGNYENSGILRPLPTS